MHLPVVALAVSGLYGLVASFVLTMEKMALLENPAAVPSCTLNPIVSCTSAINSSQALTFGIPNSLFGIVAYSALLTVVGLLIMKVPLGRMIWSGIIVAAVSGFIGTLWLIMQSVLVLHVVCPWCFGVWVTTPVVVLAVCRLYAVQGFGVRSYDAFVYWVADRIKVAAVVWYSAFTLLLLVVFWDFWSTLLPL